MILKYNLSFCHHSNWTDSCQNCKISLSSLEKNWVFQASRLLIYLSVSIYHVFFCDWATLGLYFLDSSISLWIRFFQNICWVLERVRYRTQLGMNYLLCLNLKTSYECLDTDIHWNKRFLLWEIRLSKCMNISMYNEKTVLLHDHLSKISNDWKLCLQLNKESF